jgi:hypothetical protein
MTKKPLLLVAAALAAALLTLGLVLLLAGGDGKPRLVPLEPPPGESLRLQKPAEKPPTADPAEVVRALGEEPALPGDAVLVEALKAAVAAGEPPTYKLRIDVPLADNAAQAVRDEVRGWVERKMAALGFVGAAGKPTLSWGVHVDPGEAGKYVVQTRVRVGGEARFDEEFELPFAFSADRVDKSLATAFAAP